MMVIRPVERSGCLGADAACQQNGQRPDVASANEATLSVRQWKGQSKPGKANCPK